MKFETAVLSAVFDDHTNLWTVTTDQGDIVQARYLITGHRRISMPREPDIEADTFEGPTTMLACGRRASTSPERRDWP